MIVVFLLMGETMARKIEMIGRRFNHLTVVSDSGLVGARNRIKYKCLCDCGKETIVFGDALRSGHTKSCGCHRLEVNTKHGKCGSGSYISWDKMIQRCKNPNNSAYKHYGERGIYVCDEWLDFSNFYKDMGDRPKGMTIERVNSEDGYHKGNCVWVSQSDQTRNTSRNIIVSISSRLLTVSEISEITGRTYNSVNNILWKYAKRVNKCYMVDDDLCMRFFKELMND